MVEILIRIVLTVLPMYFANSCALLFGGKNVLDNGIVLADGKRLLGNGKTWSGTIGGMACGILSAFIIAGSFPEQILLVNWNYLGFGILASIGAVLGDILASFLKRRLGKNQGSAIPLLDQLDFVAGGLILGSVFYIPPLNEIILIALLTMAMHVLTNRLAFILKIKNVPW